MQTPRFVVTYIHTKANRKGAKKDVYFSET